MESVFKTEHRTFSKRFIKKLLPPIIFYSAILLYILIRDKTGGVVLLYIISGIGIGYSIYYIIKTRTDIDEIRINEKIIVIVGYSFDKKWEKQLDIQTCSIKIRSIPSRSGNHEYYLTITSKGNKYHVNRFSNWDYNIILNLFNEFKIRKGERIIMDEKYFVGYLEKKIARELQNE